MGDAERALAVGEQEPVGAERPQGGGRVAGAGRVGEGEAGGLDVRPQAATSDGGEALVGRLDERAVLVAGAQEVERQVGVARRIASARSARAVP